MQEKVAKERVRGRERERESGGGMKEPEEDKKIEKEKIGKGIRGRVDRLKEVLKRKWMLKKDFYHPF